jgi:hypothetical protein
MTQKPELTEAYLSQFGETTKTYGHWTGCHYTDGIHFLIEEGKVPWLLDLIFFYQWDDRLPDRFHVQFWELNIRDDRSAVLTCVHDTEDLLVRLQIPYIDLPLRKLIIFVDQRTAFLPSEY